MRVIIEVPDYIGRGLHFEWEEGFKIFAEVNVQKKYTSIFGNKAGLISLARILLSLAQDGIPNDYHIHLDYSNSLEEGSSEIILGRRED